IDTRALKSAKCQELGHTAVFDQIAVTVEHFDVLVWPDRAGRNAASNDAPEIGVRLENSAEHAERPIFDLGRSAVVEQEVKERQHRLLRPFQCWCHPTFLGRAIKNWKVKLSLGGVEGGEQVEYLVHHLGCARVRAVNLVDDHDGLEVHLERLGHDKFGLRERT